MCIHMYMHVSTVFSHFLFTVSPNAMGGRKLDVHIHVASTIYMMSVICVPCLHAYACACEYSRLFIYVVCVH